MKKKIFVAANPTAKVSIEREYYPVSPEKDDTEDNPVIIKQRHIIRSRRPDIGRERMISLFRCGICEAGYNSSNCLHDEFFEKECACCGSTDHSFLDIKYEEDNEVLISLICACPLVNHSIVKEKMLSGNNKKYWIDPHRLAKECGYQEKEVDYLLERIQTKGCGRRMYSDDISRIQEAAHHSCETERNMCKFTRDTAYHPGNDSEDEQENEDMMSICSSTNSSL